MTKKFVVSLMFLLILVSSSVWASDLSDKEIENIVKRSYQYVAMYNVINNFAMNRKNPYYTGGWNSTYKAKGLLDHTVRAIARPNNDTLYVISTLDLRTEPVVVHYPAFDSKYVSLQTSAYDHYVDIPLSTSKGDFEKPVKVLFYSDRTKGYDGRPIKNIDRVLKMSGDFVIVFLRIMPHATEPDRLKKNLQAIDKVEVMTLSEFLGKKPIPSSPVDFPDFGNDMDVFEKNFLEVMQFVFNHTTFDKSDKLDRGVLSALKPLGVVPGWPFDPKKVVKIDGKRFRKVAEKIKRESLRIWNSPDNPYLFEVFKPKGQMSLEAMVVQSAVGPIGQPASEAVYIGITTKDGKLLNAMNDYVIRMSKNQLPPAKAFWSVTVYDAQTGFFIPNDRKKYSVGENAGMKLDKDGGIAIYISSKKPSGVPDENWIPIKRENKELDIIMRVYLPDLEKMKTWEPPKAEILN